MGTQKFQAEYIEYLEECNTLLHDELLKFNDHEKRLLNKELRKEQFENTLKEITDICNSTCEAVDNLFENFTATMKSMKNVLLLKSKISQIPQKLSLHLNPDVINSNQTSVSSSSDNGVSSLSEGNELKNGKKCGTAKPMIKGHVISAPTIHLSRVNEELGSQTSRSMTSTLSPILEISPSTSPNADSLPREILIPLQRLDHNNFGSTTLTSEDSNRSSSPKISFFRNKSTKLKLKHYSYIMNENSFRLLRPRDRELKDKDIKDDYDEVLEKRFNIREAKEKAGVRVGNSLDDPLEGPSWMLDKPRKGRSQSSKFPFPYSFINFRRQNCTPFKRISLDNKGETLTSNDDAEVNNFESKQESEMPAVQDENKNEGRPSWAVNDDSHSEYEEQNSSKSGMIEEKSHRSSKIESNNPTRNSVRRSKDLLDFNNQRSKNDKCKDVENFSASEILTNGHPRISTNCSVNVDRLSIKATNSSHCPLSVVSPMVNQNKKSSVNKKSLEVEDGKLDTLVNNSPNVKSVNRLKRRAAELCKMQKNWLEITPKGERKAAKKSTKTKRTKERSFKNGKSKQ